MQSKSKHKHEHKSKRKHKSDPLVGRRFGRLVVVRRLPNRKRGAKNTRARVLCQCDCGNRIVTPRMYLTRRSNPKRNCGRCNTTIEVSRTHHPEYGIWQMMKRRCYDPTHVSYEHYGAKGVRVCGRWLDSFEIFLADVGPRPPGFSLDRIDPTGDYTPENVRWADSTTQANNKRANSKPTPTANGK